MAKIRPPFTWFGRYTNWLVVGGLVIVAAFFRFYELTTLPPGLYTGEAQVGLDAMRLMHGALPGFVAANGYAPLWTVLQALSIMAFGHTALALRLWPALIGVGAVVVTWLWARTWFDQRVALVAAFVVAVTPWSVTLSRNALPVALIGLLVPLTLWAASWAYHRGGLKWWLVTIGLGLLDLLSGPLGWLLALTVAVLGTVRLAQRGQMWPLNRNRLIAGGTLVLGLAGAGYVAGRSLEALRQLPAALGLVSSPAALADAVARTLLMFNLHGDDNMRHNFGGEPLLNAFVGLMFVAGLLVAISRFAQRRYRVLLMLFIVFLAPAAISVVGLPNAAHAAAVLPVVAVLAAVGVSYMLELWYATFPINSAARTTGQAVIIVLLALTLFQGYTQYFRAWAGSTETYAAYNEPAVAVAKFVQAEPAKTIFYAVAQSDELPVVAYLNNYINDESRYIPLTPGQVAGVPLGGTKQFVITAAARDEAAKSLSLKFPGGKLRPYTSAFSQDEIYYTYEMTP